jgi:OOP family OmpA-OmpF porin
MRGKALRALLFVMVGGLLIGLATQSVQAGPRALDLNPKLQAGELIRKVDGFLVILDASSSMADSHEGRVKLDAAKEMLTLMNQTIPDLRLTGMIRTYGHTLMSLYRKTIRIYGPTEYSKEGFSKALAKVDWAGGVSPLGLAITAGIRGLKRTDGAMAVIIVTDAEDLTDRPVAAAQNMKEQYGDRVCIYTILVGDDPGGKDLMAQIAETGQCGFSVTAESIASPEGMADYVERVFFTRRPKPLDSDGDGVPDDLDQCPDTPAGVRVDSVGCPLDNDGDGVPDYLDQCPDTLEGVQVDSKGCPLDTDGDGVPDFLDECPDTPAGVEVDDRGCPLDTDGDGVPDYLDQCPRTPMGARVDERGCWIIGGATFDTDKWDIKPQYYPVLNEMVAVLERNPSLNVVIQGHTDNRGTAAHNQKLSENRAKSVLEYFVEKGITRERLSAVGFGFSSPAATNETPEGQAKNRRVELKPIWE